MEYVQPIQTRSEWDTSLYPLSEKTFSSQWPTRSIEKVGSLLYEKNAEFRKQVSEQEQYRQNEIAQEWLNQLFEKTGKND